MSLFGSLYVGTSGLQTQQNALNTTAHNMTNVDTKGYTRQQILLGTRSYNTLSISASAVAKQQVGLGVQYSQVRQIRDEFIDKTYRRESGRSAFYETNTQALEEIEDIFGEFQGAEFSTALENLWTSIQELGKQPCDLTNQNLFVSRSEEFMTRAKLVYDGLSEQQTNLNGQVKKDVAKINAYGGMIADLNIQILETESGGIEHANDLRDTRNRLLDELSKMGSITYSEDMHGTVSVKMEGISFVGPDSYNKVELHQDLATGFYTPYWSHLAAEKTNVYGQKVLDLQACRLFDPTQSVSMDMNTDIGSLRAELLARGERKATYKDLQDVDNYDENISQSLLMNVQAEFDQLINKVVTTINDVLKKAAESEPDTNYMKDADGKPLQLFQMIADDSGEGFTVGNIILNADIKREPSMLSFRLKDGSEDQATTNNLIKAFSAEDHKLNPNLETKTNLLKYYSNLVSQVTYTGERNKGIAEGQKQAVNETSSAKEMVVGVSADEEMEFMIKFQNAFNASSRYINVINELMDHVINTLGR